jgi:hypothetical protein
LANQGYGFQVRRLIFLLCAVALLFDRVDDGFIGKVKFVAPQPATNFSVTFTVPAHNHNFSTAGAGIGLAANHWGYAPDLLASRPYVFRVNPSHKIIFCALHGSSGGIPL